MYFLRELSGYALAAPRTGLIAELARMVCARASELPRTAPALLAALSGIDGSGKSHLSRELAQAVEALGLRVALIGIDPWQNPQSVRFRGSDPAAHFYHHAIRFDALFEQLVRPLVAHRSIRLNTKGIRTDRDAWYDLVYDFEDVDVVLVEGILLFQRPLVDRYDLRIWVECSFETALARALERNVEDLSRARLMEDYARIYHAAQRYHFIVDAPQSQADVVFLNEARRREGAAPRPTSAAVA